jgi:hypothetical protein
MSSTRSDPPGTGPLTARLVVNDAAAMLRQSLARIAGVAVVFFALPAAVTIVAEAVISALPADRPGLTLVALAAALVVAGSLSVLGPIAFAGFLDEAVAKEYLHGRHKQLGEVLRELPWRVLIIADVIVVVVVGVGLALFVLPGLVAFGGLGLVGVVVVQEHAGVRDSFRRTVFLARRAPMLVAILVVLPFAIEEIIHGVLYDTLHNSGLGVQVVAEWVLAIALGATLGLLEVALATELIARNPRRTEAALLNDRQASTV